MHSACCDPTPGKYRVGGFLRGQKYTCLAAERERKSQKSSLPFSSAAIVQEELETPTLITSLAVFSGGGLQICCEKFKCVKVEEVVTKHVLKEKWMFALCLKSHNLSVNREKSVF